jgi:hypothetical protein
VLEALGLLVRQLEVVAGLVEQPVVMAQVHMETVSVEITVVVPVRNLHQVRQTQNQHAEQFALFGVLEGPTHQQTPVIYDETLY